MLENKNETKTASQVPAAIAHLKEREDSVAEDLSEEILKKPATTERLNNIAVSLKAIQTIRELLEKHRDRDLQPTQTGGGSGETRPNSSNQ